MKALVISFLFVISLNAQNYFIFSELKGMEDNTENTHLFYRLYYYKDNPVLTRIENSIYHLDLYNNIDTLFLFDGGWFPDDVRYVNDFDIFSLDSVRFVFCGSTCVVECVPYVSLSDSNLNFETGWGSSYKVKFGNNDSLVYYGLDSYIFQPPVFPQLATFKSTDGGYNWELLSEDKIFFSLSPYDNNISFYIDKFSYRTYKSTNGGNQFYLVDTLVSLPSNTSFFYDFDKNHIYKTTYNGIFSLVVSDNLGEPFTWSIKYQSNNRIFISIDNLQSGSIYLADGRYIYHSMDYGTTFSEFKVLDRSIVGIYKKPNSDKLYAATKYDLYEITPDTTIIIKNLPLNPELFQWYPISIGNRWIYDYQFLGDPTETGVYITEIAGDTSINNQNYFVLNSYLLMSGILSKVNDYGSYLRVDSLSGKIFRAYYYNGVFEEYIFTDLTLEVGDTLYDNEYRSLAVLYEEPFNQWGLNSTLRYFDIFGTSVEHHYSLVKEIGINYEFVWELSGSQINLRGCIIDGITYGDTTTVDVEDFEEPIQSFSLSQNYPNPFNPSTSIEYRVASREYVTLKVYDVLGREVATLVNEEKQPGIYEVEFQSSVGSRQLATGVYYYQFRAGSYIETKKMIYLK